MSALLVSLAVWLNGYAVNEWACDLVNSKNFGKGGCYDECLLLQKDYGTKDQPALLVSFDEYGQDIANACAIVTYGGEY